MPKIAVEIMPKPELLDPQGKAVGRVLSRQGIEQVRIGKRFEVITAGPVSDALLERITGAAGELFSNPVIEDVVAITVEEA